MNKKLNRLIFLFKEDIGLFLSTSFGIFLFVLFFQPFTIKLFDFNNNLLFVAGLGTITLLFMYLMRLILFLSKDKPDRANDTTLSYFTSGTIVLILSSTSYAFYLLYVGRVEITFPIMFRIVLICLAPPVILHINDLIKETRGKYDALLKEKDELIQKVYQYQDDYQNRTIEFNSENISENFMLPAADIVMIKSADNYVEIIYKEAEVLKKKLLRNTLKNIEHQLKPFSIFIRCHRICIVNKFFIERLTKQYNNYYLIIKGYEDRVPVSRQYLNQVKEGV